MSVFRRTIFKSRKTEAHGDEDRGKDTPRDAPPNSQDANDQNGSDIQEEIIRPDPFAGRMPTFFHIGGLATACLTIGYNIGAWHIDCTSKASDVCTLYNYGTARPDSKTISGGVGIRERIGMLNMTQVWQTEGILGTLGISTEDGDGRLNAMLRVAYAAHGSSGVMLDLHTGYEQTPIKFDLIVPLMNVAHLKGYVVVQPAEDFLLGYRMVYDWKRQGFDQHAIAAGYNNGRTELCLKLENFKQLRGSVFQRLGDRWAVTLKGDLYKDEPKHIAIGAQCNIDTARIKAKLSNDGFLGAVFQHDLSENIRIMYHLGCDISAPIEGNHKMGISWSFTC
ncbi:uncharacterized protein LOC6567102 [Drosophila grimshawi]|uniref:GH13334 n=1 Tax=Drosophila grimshawi TaxID=7222 RepID=B4JPU7_DROGR|nr:uncharacterized protein LOC6567102 [Drosophila grimshawi]EDV98927.1 GH13334 [Drosophila grimshawi]